MPIIQPVQPKVPIVDIYTYGFDKSLNRTLPDVPTGIGTTLDSTLYNESDVLYDSTKGHNHDGGVGGRLVSADGWQIAPEQYVCSSVDAPTYVIRCEGDVTGKYWPGMRMRLYQGTTTAKYFLITAVALSNQFTNITLYGGTDYTLTADRVTSSHYSMWKAPFGFPLNPTKWTVKFTDATNRSQNSPVSGTWYNLSSMGITIPIGIWNVDYVVQILASRATSTYALQKVTLSTANNTESDSEFTTMGYNEITYSASITVHQIGITLSRNKVLSLSSKTPYYLNTCTVVTGVGDIYYENAACPLIIRAVSAYL